MQINGEIVKNFGDLGEDSVELWEDLFEMWKILVCGLELVERFQGFG
jgi:hypothetical protein